MLCSAFLCGCSFHGRKAGAAVAAAAKALGGGNQIAPFQPPLAAEAPSHKEDEEVVQRLLGCVTLKVVSKLLFTGASGLCAAFPSEDAGSGTGV